MPAALVVPPAARPVDDMRVVRVVPAASAVLAALAVPADLAARVLAVLAVFLALIALAVDVRVELAAPTVLVALAVALARPEVPAFVVPLLGASLVAPVSSASPGQVPPRQLRRQRNLSRGHVTWPA
jgi:hypothetical protein